MRLCAEVGALSSATFSIVSRLMTSVIRRLNVAAVFCVSGSPFSYSTAPRCRLSVSIALTLFHRRTRDTYLYNACLPTLPWNNVVLTARSLKREIQTTGAKC